MPKDVNGIGCVLDSNAAAEPERLEAGEEVIGRGRRGVPFTARNRTAIRGSPHRQGLKATVIFGGSIR